MNHNKPSPIPTDFQKKTCWSALTGLSVATILALAVAGIYIASLLLGFLQPVLLPVMLAAVIAYLLDPLVEWLVRRKFSRISAVCTVMGTTLLAIVGFFLMIVPPLVQQTGQLVDNRVQIWNSASNMAHRFLALNEVEEVIDSMYKKAVRNQEDLTPVEKEKLLQVTSPKEKLSNYLNLNSNRLFNKASSWLTSGGEAIYGMLGITIGLIMTPIFLFYFLAESRSIRDHWHDILPIKTSHFKEELVETLQEINGYLISFFRGQMLVSIIDGMLIAIVLKIVGLPYAFTIGAAVAILGIVPYVGILITIIPAVLIAWFTWNDWQHIVLVVGIFTAVNQFDGWFIQPKIVGNSVGLHPLTVMFSVLFWTLVIGGMLGALLAVPLTAAIKVIFRRYIWQTMQVPLPVRTKIEL